MFGRQHSKSCVALTVIIVAVWVAAARAMEFDFSGYGDARIIAEPSMTGWLQGGLGKFRYGGSTGDVQFEGAGQGVLKFDDEFSVIALARADEEQINGLDLLEAYLAWHPEAEGNFSWSVKAGAFFPTISLENDDLGWTSPYTLTYSAINSWVGEELRTLGAEGTLRYHTNNLGTVSLIGSLNCCNDPAGVLMADRGWAMDDRPTGLFEHVREPDATMQVFHAPFPARTGLFDEIDHRAGWYGGLSWQMANVGKLSVLRYENQGDPAAISNSVSAWETKFWSFGARTQINSLVLIAQQLSGYTAVDSRGQEFPTKFQSGFLLASYDLSALGLDDMRASARADVFQTRHLGTAPLMNEDGRAMTVDLSWQPTNSFRLTGEALVMHSRKGEYTLVGVPSGELNQNQLQLDAKVLLLTGEACHPLRFSQAVAFSCHSLASAFVLGDAFSKQIHLRDAAHGFRVSLHGGAWRYQAMAAAKSLATPQPLACIRPS